MTITVKRWIGDQKYDEMKAYKRDVWVYRKH